MLKAKEREVLDLQVAITEAKEHVIREEERNSQRELELFVENQEIRSQQRELQDLANEYMQKWKITEEQRAQISDSYHQLQVEEREFMLTKIHTTENGSDMLTKVLTPDKLGACRKQIELEQHPMPE